MSARVGTALCPGPLEHLHSLESPAQATEFQISEKWIPCGVLYSTPNFLYFLFPLILLLSHHLHSYEGRVPLNPMLTCSFLSGQHSLCGLVVLNAKHSRKKNSILSALKLVFWTKDSVPGENVKRIEQRTIGGGEAIWGKPVPRSFLTSCHWVTGPRPSWMRSGGLNSELWSLVVRIPSVGTFNHQRGNSV